MSEIFNLNVLALYLVYGLSFYTMGVAIALQYRSYSSFRLAHSLSFLAAFALLHGLSEWGSVFIPVKVPNFGDFPLWKLIAIQRLLQSVSYYFLFCFGVKLISDSKSQDLFWWLTLPTAAFLAWLIQFSRFIPLVGTEELITWLLHSECWSRYLLAFPAGIFTAYGLYLQIPEAVQLNDRTVLRNLWTAIIAFGLFTFFSGLVVPHDQIGGLSSLINAAKFKSVTGLPIEVFRTITALMATYSITRLLSIFDLDRQRQIAESRRLEAIYRERERFARDLHDDVIQSIFGIGLQLQITANKIGTEPDDAKRQVISSVHRLNKVIHTLRAYIQGLETKGAEMDLKTSLEALIKEYQDRTGLKTELRFNISPGIRIQPAADAEDWEQQLRQIVREALNNAAKHAQATEVQVELSMEGRNLFLTIQDNGIGIRPERISAIEEEGKHMGVKNMRRRTKLLGGQFQLHSRPLNGTMIEIKIPIS